MSSAERTSWAARRQARARDLRLLPVVAVVWTFVGVVVSHEAAAAAMAAGCVIGCGIALTTALRFRRVAPQLALLAIALALSAGAAGQVAVSHPGRDAVAEVHSSGGRVVEVDAVVVGKVERRTRGWDFDAVIQRISVAGDESSTGVPVSVSVTETSPELDIGARIRFTGSAEEGLVGSRNVLRLRAADLIVLEAPPGPLAVTSALRHGLQRATMGLPQPASGLIAGLSVGDTSAVTAELDAAMKASALSHLTAVSGANCALVMGIAYALGSLLGARRGVRIGAALVVLIGFVILVTPEPSVVRAAAMGAIAMLALALGRTGAGVSVLSTAIAILLMIDPWLSLSLGFALSSAATGALLLLAAPLARGLERWLPAPLALAIAVPLAAQLACGPLLVLIEPTVPLWGVLANLVAGPAAPAATVLGLLACLSAPLPVIAHGLAAMAWMPAAWIAQTAHVTVALPGNTMPWLDGLSGAAALAVTGAALIVVIALDRRRPRLRAAAVLLLAGVVGALLAAGPVHAVLERLRTPRDWQVVGCDVGQGDAVLVRSEGRIALIDAGPAPERLRACLDRFGVDRIDLLVLTHFDMDHRGGVEAVIGRVGAVLHGPTEDAEAAAVVARLSRAGAQAVRASAGMTGQLGVARWRVLWPRSQGVGFTGNDASLVLEVTADDAPSILLLGDLSAGPQVALGAAIARSYDIVKVAHHGSADQHHPLYARVSPQLALFSVGENTYGHPREEIIDALSDIGARIVRTDMSGAVAVWRGRDGAVSVWHERGVDGAR